MTLTDFAPRAELVGPDDDDARWWLTARGAMALGLTLTLDPAAHQGTLVAFSDELGTWVRLR
jgi:hypothetical protein